ncbi:MAG: hypothetical protein CVU02_00655 [Bacteroidetes bacterium HGW-Bacteroidetes-19]|nr:MAG: hypothetical protein CVU02_00655 [Bacteroidetes bacterium HGW-Bacteroidetes-19]
MNASFLKKLKIKMRLLLLIIMVSGIFQQLYAQTVFPSFLNGTWKMEDKEVYEHWDLMNENSLKGISYANRNGVIVVMEYLEISNIQNEVLYSATVVDQNNGDPIYFKLIQSDSIFVFVNPYHDFPQKIVYQKIDDKKIFVQVLGKKEEEFSYFLIKK